MEVAGWMSEFGEVAQGTPEMVVDPETPLSMGPQAEEECPAPARMNLDVVRDGGLVPVDGRGGEGLAAARSDVVVATAQHQGEKMERVVVEMAFIVRSIPLVNPDGASETN